MSTEEWLPVPDFEGFYEVSDRGRVRSLPRKFGKGCVLKSRPLPKTGYLQVSLSKNGKVTIAYVHALVAAAFIGPRPPGEEVRHGDGNPANNELGNLSYSTHLVNMGDTLKHGTRARGERQGRAVLANADAAVIRDRWARGETITELAAAFGTGKPVISRVVSGTAYSDTSWTRPQEVCRFPDCEELAEQPSLRGGKNGRPGLYCDNPEHTRETAKAVRVRQTRQAEARLRTSTCPQCKKPFTLGRSDQVFCSRDCKKIAGNIRARHRSLNARNLTVAS